MYSLIENFCLGQRRLEIFARAPSLRPGWVSVGDLSEFQHNNVGAVPWFREQWESNLVKAPNGKYVVPMSAGSLHYAQRSAGTATEASSSSAEIDMLRPKSPVRNNPGGGGHAHSHSQSMQSAPAPHGMPMQPGLGLPMNPMANMGGMMGGGGGMPGVAMPVPVMAAPGMGMGMGMGGMGGGAMNMGHGMGMGMGMGMVGMGGQQLMGAVNPMMGPRFAAMNAMGAGGGFPQQGGMGMPAGMAMGMGGEWDPRVHDGPNGPRQRDGHGRRRNEHGLWRRRQHERRRALVLNL